MRLVGGTAEGGLGKLTLDLGLPGLLTFLWLMITIVRMIWWRLSALAKDRRRMRQLDLALSACWSRTRQLFQWQHRHMAMCSVLITLGTM